MGKPLFESHSGARGSAAKWLAVGLLAVIAACLLVELGAATSPARAQTGSGSDGKGLFVVAGQVTRDSYGLYLVDVANSTVCVYQYLPSTRKLRLMASRNFSFDRQLDDYNTEPSPRRIRELVQQHKRLTAGEKPKKPK